MSLFVCYALIGSCMRIKNFSQKGGARGIILCAGERGVVRGLYSVTLFQRLKFNHSLIFGKAIEWLLLFHIKKLYKGISFLFVTLARFIYIWGAVLIFFRYNLISKDKFFITIIRILDIRKWCFLYKPDIMKMFLDIKNINWIFRHQKIVFFISEN